MLSSMSLPLGSSPFWPVGAVVEILHQRRAVVLLDQVDDRLRQVMLPGQVGAVLDVGDNHQRAHRRHERLVAAGLGALVLDEIAGLEHLADVVEIGPHADQQAAGADALRGRLGDRADGDRMVVGAGRAADQLLQERMGDVAQLQQAEVREHAENLLDEGEQAGHDEAGGDGPQAGHRPPLSTAADRAAGCRSR